MNASALLRPAAVLALLLVACSSGPKFLPRNEINDPIFHQTDYADIGLAAGPSWTRYDEERVLWSSPGLLDTIGGEEFVPSPYLIPFYAYTRMVGKSTSYALLPVFWNYLVTGDQYADSVNLASKRVHLSLHGGINGLSYSQRNGWVWSAAAGLAGKYLMGPRGFLSGDLFLHWNNLANLSLRRYQASLLAGRQLTRRGSLRAEYTWTFYDLPQNAWGNFRGIEFLGEDVQSSVNLRYSFYGTPKHVFGPEAGLAFRHRGMEDNFSLSVGARYRFVFQ